MSSTGDPLLIASVGQPQINVLAKSFPQSTLLSSIGTKGGWKRLSGDVKKEGISPSEENSRSFNIFNSTWIHQGIAMTYHQCLLEACKEVPSLSDEDKSFTIILKKESGHELQYDYYRYPQGFRLDQVSFSGHDYTK